MIKFRHEPTAQRRLEETVRAIIARTHAYVERHGTIAACADKEKGHCHSVLDGLADTIYREKYPNFSIFTEETDHRLEGKPMLIADPNDGSSEALANGPKKSPLCTTAMILDNETIVAAAAGDIWGRTIFGIDRRGLYQHGAEASLRSVPDYIHPCDGVHEIRLAAFARRSSRGKLLYGLGKLLAEGNISYYNNDGGGLYSLFVAFNWEKGYNAAAELKPVPLYEHITSIMATQARLEERKGSDVVLLRADGEEFKVNPDIDQTSVVTSSRAIMRRLLPLLKKVYKKAPTEHVKAHGG